MYEHIRDGKELIQRFFGQTTGKEVEQSVLRFHSSSHFDEVTDVIFDFLDVTEITIQEGIEEDISAADGAASMTNPRIRIAVITDRREIIKAAENYCATGLSNYPLQIFTAVDDARKWFATTPLTSLHFGKSPGSYKVAVQGSSGIIGRISAVIFQQTAKSY